MICNAWTKYELRIFESKAACKNCGGMNLRQAVAFGGNDQRGVELEGPDSRSSGGQVLKDPDQPGLHLRRNRTSRSRLGRWSRLNCGGRTGLGRHERALNRRSR